MTSLAHLILLHLLALIVAPLCQAAEPINLRVVWTESPQTEAVVAWDSVGNGDGTLHIAEVGGKATSHQATVDAYPGSEGDMITHCYRVQLRDLKPATRYNLTAQIGSTKGSEQYFITAPDKDAEFKLFFVGDSRSGIDNTRAVSLEMKRAMEQDPAYLCLLHGGDFANKDILKDWDPWLSAYALTTTDDGRILPIIPVIGNHEKEGVLYNIAYGTPGENAEQNYFLCMPSPQVAIIGLNTNISAEGDQREFLQKTLEQLKEEKVRYQLPAYHRPAYPAVKTPKGARASWVPLFEEYNVDLGLESDGHCIKRTVPIRNDQPADDGVVYLGEGGYGVKQRTPNKNDLWYLKEPGFSSQAHHYMVLSFTPEAIHYWTTTLGGEQVDSATFAARKR